MKAWKITMTYEFEMASECIPSRKIIRGRIDNLLKKKAVRAENFEWEEIEEIPYS